MEVNMKSAVLLISCAVSVWCQQQPTAPIYQVTVVERTVKAINYKYRSDPTMIDFRGTVLLPKAKGGAIVQSKQGRTEIDVHFENLNEPQRFGLEYMTYVLWALTPDGRPHNIGEVVAGSSDKAHLHVTTDMQAFAMIVTAEPYSAVRQPSNVVVLENAVRPDTEGKIEEVEARVELLPRGLYSYHVSEPSPAANAPKVSMREYEALSELYQAQNAIGIARAANAEQYAPNTFAKAQQLLTEAQQIEAGKKDSSRVVETAREAAETAEDARVIAIKHQQEDQIAKAQVDAAQARRAAVIAEQDALKARADADAAQAQADAERAARQHAEAEASAARDRAAQAEAQIAAPPPRPQQPTDDSARKTALRMQVMEQLNSALPTRDTGRGLVATIAGARFNGSLLSETTMDQLARIAVILNGHPELRIDIEGHTDIPDTTGISQRRADAVREVLVARGVRSGMILARGFGNTHPLASNRTPSGREENQRVEIVISGDAIGNIPFWDRTYTLTTR
jgi:outer membrane protein OmpA-like peptidoglycan-associated protein